MKSILLSLKGAKLRDTQAVADHVLKYVDLSDTKLPSEYNYASLPLCVVDAVFSIGVKYGSTEKAVRNWCAWQTPCWSLVRTGASIEHSTSNLVEILEQYDPEFAAECIFQNRQRTSSRSGIRKSDAVLRFARVLQQNEVEKIGDTLDEAKNVLVEEQIRRIPGQVSGLSYTYFLMLAGTDRFVKADRMLQRFVASALGRKPSLSDVRDLVINAATYLQNERGIEISPRSLDYKIWSFQRQRHRRLLGRHS